MGKFGPMTGTLVVCGIVAALSAAAWPGRGRWRLNRVLPALAVLVLGLICYAGYLGYYGGPIYTDVAPAAGGGKDRPAAAAVILSGDMGFHVGMGPKMAARLAADGVAVVGVNSLTVFRTRRTQQDAASMIERAVRHAMAFGRADRVILIGQSYGADMLQSGAPLLPPSIRRHIALVALVVPGETVSYRASPSDLLSLPGDEVDGVATGRLLGWTPTLCIFGREETDSLCPHLSPAVVTRIGLPGGHSLDSDAAALYRVLRAAIDRSLSRA